VDAVPPADKGPQRVTSVVITGVAGAVGRRVAARLIDAGIHVVGIDLLPPTPPLPGLEMHVADVATSDLKPLLEGSSRLVHLAFSYGPDLDDAALVHANVEGTRRLLESAGDAGVSHLVIVSSATVYGAWPDNPVPLTEDAPLRPNPEFAHAVQKAECERLCLEWRDGVPGATVSVLRPAISVGEEHESWLARSLRVAMSVRTGKDDPPQQFVHVEDLAAAVELGVRERLDDVYNVAADGWVDAETVRALAGTLPRVPVSERLATRTAAWTWRLRVGRTPPGLIPYTMHPWVIASDRLRAAGWSPAYSNEEAFVAGHAGTWWSRLSPSRRQEMALGAAGTLVAGAVGGAVAIVLKSRRRRSG